MGSILSTSTNMDNNFAPVRKPTETPTDDVANWQPINTCIIIGWNNVSAWFCSTQFWFNSVHKLVMCLQYQNRKTTLWPCCFPQCKLILKQNLAQLPFLLIHVLSAACVVEICINISARVCETKTCTGVGSGTEIFGHVCYWICIKRCTVES